MLRLPLPAPTRVFTLSLAVLAALSILSLGGLSRPAHAASPPAVILNASPTAHAGDVIFLQGAGFGSNPLIQFSWNSTAWTYISTLTHANNLVTFRMQPNYFNLLTVRVSGDGGSTWSAPCFINRAHAMSFDTPVVYAGSAFRIFGRNLYFGGTPTVRLVDQAAPNTSYPATVSTSTSNAYVLQVTAPTGILVGHTYNVLVDGGVDGVGTYGTGETQADESLKAIAAGADVWSLGLPWGADFSATYQTPTNAFNVLSYGAKGDGVNNDQPAIKLAINAASQAGGVVYLPAGTYKLALNPSQGAQLYLPSNVVLEGAGMGQTTLEYGFTGSDGSKNDYGITMGNGWDPVSYVGIAGLTLVNVDTSGQWTDNLFLSSNFPAHGNTPSMELFLQSVRVTASYGNILDIQGVSKLAVENCDFELLGGAATAWLGAGAHSEFYNNKVHWSGGGAVAINSAPDVVMENNHFTRDCSPQYWTYTQPQYYDNNPQYPDPFYGKQTLYPNTRCMDNSFDKNMVILNNTFDIAGGTPNSLNNDGEAIVNEGGANNPVDADYGTATSATATTLTDTSKNWPTQTTPSAFMAVAIVAGTGAGEWAYVTGVSPTTLTVSSPTPWIPNSKPWAITPDHTSVYVTTDWSAENWLVAGNTLSNYREGIYFSYCSAHDSAIVGNTLTNDTGIKLEADQQDAIRRFNPIWDTQVVGNTVSENAGHPQLDSRCQGQNPWPAFYDGSGPAAIGAFTDEVSSPMTLGTSVLGVEFRSNSVTGTGTTFVQENQSAFPPYTEGYYDLLSAEGQNLTNNLPALLGTIFQGNTATDCNTNFNTQTQTYDGAFRLNSGAYETVITDTVLNNEKSLIEDENAAGLTTGSVGTYGSLNVGGGNNWLDVDIGSSSLPGSASLSGGVFTVSGGGGDIFFGSDNFNSCSQSLTGNGTIIARVAGIGNTNSGGWSKAGVMIRAAQTATSPYADMVVEANGQAQANYRVTDGAAAIANGAVSNAFAPYWVKLVRVGSVFTSYTAPDKSGTPGTWTACGGPVTISMPATVYAGLVVSSGTNNTLNTSTLDHVTVTTP